MGQVEIYLFVNRMNTKVFQFVSWKPDHEAWETDAMKLPLGHLQAYVFPQFPY